MSTSLFGAAPPTQNPFAAASTKSDVPLNSFSFFKVPNTFGAPSGPTSNVFGSKTTSLNSTSWPKVNGNNSENSSTTLSNQSEEASSTTLSKFGSASNFNRSPFQPFKGFDGTSESSSAASITTSNKLGSSYFNKNNHYLSENCNNSPQNNLVFPPSTNSSVITEKLPKTFAEKIATQLVKDEIFPPSLATLDYSKDHAEFIKSASELRIEFLKYREKVRNSLIRAKLLDDPNVPKKLEDAIDFKGTCDDMCPEYECLTRIVDRRYDKTERDIQLDGSLSAQPNPVKMVKALARSAAGQDAPLPSDIRTAAALRRTVDHLFNTVLAERELETVHGFLWDRTRAVRRDFVFHSSMTPTELIDQVYCLERIIRFHAISLHYMSKEGIPVEGFSDQQEREQLSKSLLSLIHAYEDCKLQGVNCDNELEFKAYYILFNGEIPGIMETVQNWGWEVWEHSEIIRIAVNLSESLQNTWDFHGPLNPLSTMEISQNAYSKFFSIVEDPNVSYTMACFAEIYFNKIRKAILKTILSSYRKQRGQTKDWTLDNLNTYLRFDNKHEVEPFVESYGLHFIETDNEWCLSFDSTNFIQEPHPLPKQPHSYHLVEKKRGKHSLSEAINISVYEPRISTEVNQQISPLMDQSCAIQPILVRDPELETGSQTTTNIKNTSAPFDNSNFFTNPNSAIKQINFFNSFSSPNDTSMPSLAHSRHGLSNKLDNLPMKTLQSSSEEKNDKMSMSSLSKSSIGSSQVSSIFSPCITSPNKPSVPQNSGLFLFQNASSSNTSVTKTPIFLTDCGDLGHQLLTSSKFTSSEIPQTGFFTNTGKNKFDPAFCQLQGQKSTSGNPPLISQLSTSAASSDLQQITSTKIPEVISDITSSTDFSKNDRCLLNPVDNQRSTRLKNLTEWIVKGDGGLLEQFYEIQAIKLVDDVFTKFQIDHSKKSQEEAARLSREEADKFRLRSLSVKYGYFWREQARRLRLKRKGREARLARQEMAQNQRVEKATLSSSLIEDFTASTSSRRRARESLGIFQNPTEAGTEDRDSQSEINSVTKIDKPLNKRQRSEKSAASEFSSPSRCPPTPDNNWQKRSLLSDPSYLSGQSRIHLKSNPIKNEEKSRPVNGVQTDYFRLKARGIKFHTSRSSVNENSENILRRTRGDGILSNRLTRSSISSDDLKSDSFMSSTRQKIGAISMNEDFDSETLEPKFKEKIPGAAQNHKRLFSDDDSALFNRAKKVRDQMDEGADWFRKEIEKGMTEK